jgi:two-component system OmpR family response regulator
MCLPLNILAVDDEADILDLINISLSADDHVVTTAGSVAAAQDLVQRNLYDLYILDLSLGDGSGLDLVETIRARDDGWIIILSGRTDPIDRVIGLEIGADDYINKPFHIRELRSRVNAVQRRMTPEAIARRSARMAEGFAALQIDFVKRRAQLPDETTVSLSAQEAAVLHLLLDQPGTTHSREDIMKTALGGHQDRDERTVDTLIKRLRGKLFPDGSGPRWIKTVHQKGYQIPKGDAA